MPSRKFFNEVVIVIGWRVDDDFLQRQISVYLRVLNRALFGGSVSRWLVSAPYSAQFLFCPRIVNMDHHYTPRIAFAIKDRPPTFLGIESYFNAVLIQGFTSLKKVWNERVTMLPIPRSRLRLRLELLEDTNIRGVLMEPGRRRLRHWCTAVPKLFGICIQFLLLQRR
ncbi:hypothetical protein BS47DRAFT_1388233 [Hydnum rufescens UP504]|uniref:Uncharacterized protein n=1 Tax=Hydnum rufescens UP504 TaxID=1448309 RepID=A0A9P6B7W4_9AGAM|nr:hypothetical protein BS47DRAFT_1388233 [Hydnum rufescens UP504]